MRVISPDVFYRYLITNENFSNDLALYPNNQYLDENGNLKNKFNLNIFNLSGDWFENQVNTMNTQKDDNKLLKYRRMGTKTPAEKRDSLAIQRKWNNLPEKEKAKYEVQEQKCGGKTKKHLFGGNLLFR